jgi:hypothetical protein
MCFIVRKTISELERVILTTLYLAGARNTNSWHSRKGDLLRTLPLDVSIVSLSSFTVSGDGERLMCGGFSLSETIHLGSFDFIADYFGGLSLPHRRNDSGTSFMGSTRSGPPSPRWVMIEDSIEEFHTASSGEGGFGLPSPRRHDMRALPAPLTTTPWLENAPATRAMMMVPPWALAAWLDIGLPFERWRTS